MQARVGCTLACFVAARQVLAFGLQACACNRLADGMQDVCAAAVTCCDQRLLRAPFRMQCVERSPRHPEIRVEDHLIEIPIGADGRERKAEGFAEPAKRGRRDDVDIVPATPQGEAEAEKRVHVAVAAERCEEDAHVQLPQQSGKRREDPRYRPRTNATTAISKTPPK